MEPGYSLAEIQARIREGGRTLALNRIGRYEWRTGDGVNEGDWRVEGEVLVLRNDVVNGIRILPALRAGRNWTMRPNGELVNTGSYNAYNIEEFHTPQ